MRLLLVEDDLKIASFILKGMKAEGYAVDHASDGQEGLHMAVTEPYDAAIVDVMLPKLDGLSLIADHMMGHREPPFDRDSAVRVV